MQTDNELPVPDLQKKKKKKKKMRVTFFVSEIKRLVNYTDFEKVPHIIEHGLQWFI